MCKHSNGHLKHSKRHLKGHFQKWLVRKNGGAAAAVLALLLLEDEKSENEELERKHWVQPCLANKFNF